MFTGYLLCNIPPQYFISSRELTTLYKCVLDVRLVLGSSSACSVTLLSQSVRFGDQRWNMTRSKCNLLNLYWKALCLCLRWGDPIESYVPLFP